MSLKKNITITFVSLLFICSIAGAWGSGKKGFIPQIYNNLIAPSDSLPYPIEEREEDFVSDDDDNSFNLDDPPAIQQNVEYDPETGTYVVTETIGDSINYRPPTYLTFEEFWNIKQQELQQGYWLQKSKQSSPLQGDGIIPQLYVGSDLFESIFGSPEIDIRPTGNIDMEFGFRSQRIDNPALLSSVRRQGPNFLFDMNVDMGVTGKIGDKMKIDTKYNTRAVFDFDNQIRLGYSGDEDEIIQEINAGNVNFPLPTTLIQGSQNLFGIQSKFRFGRLTINTVLSQQRSQNRNLTIQNGGQEQRFEIAADQYDVDRHFFLAQYFRDNYEKALSSLPFINSEVIITRVDVYVADNRGTPDDPQRDIMAFSDLGEYDPYSDNVIVFPGNKLPDNGINDLYQKLIGNPTLRELVEVSAELESPAGEFRLTDVVDFKKTMARKLDYNEYTFDPQLGYISLNSRLPDNAVLAVAYEYTTIYGGLYRVGELSEERPATDDEQDPNVIFLKMLKSIRHEPTHPNWDLMMKNIYSLGAYQVEPNDFQLDVYYEDPGGGDLRYIPEGEGIKGIPLIKIMGFDQVNINNEPNANCIFDFIPVEPAFFGLQTNNAANINNGGGGRGFGGGGFNGGNANNGQTAGSANNAFSYGTINTRNGKIIFPVLEPFGDHLEEEFLENNNSIELANKYTYHQLYDSTQIIASMYPEFNRFLIKGRYTSNTSSEISLGAFNVPEGSVRVTAGGRVLQEGIDYEINYSLGRIRILNEAYLNQGGAINVSYQDNGTFGLQQRTLIGTRFDYQVDKDFNIGATFMRLSERPFTQKVNYGDDPIANSMVGMDVNYFKEAPGITKALDALPLIETKEPSSVTLNAEGAGFLPGNARGINTRVDKGGAVYLDDFEGARTQYDLKFPYTAWTLASTPKNAPDENGVIMFPEANNNNDLTYNYNRAKIAWYQVDNFFSRRGLNSASGEASSAATLSNHYVRSIPYTEVFPNGQNINPINGGLFPLDLAYYPSERGPYNYETDGEFGVSKGTNPDGTLIDPGSRWAGIMRQTPYKDFERTNVEFVEFWMMDPFIYDESNRGDLYLHLGNVSEDILKDGQQFYENALNPSAVTDESEWGIISKTRPVVFAFDNDPSLREQQDVGFDGLNNEQEATKFDNYLQEIQSVVTNEVYQQIADDPSNDDFTHFRDGAFSDLTNETGNYTDNVVLQRYKDFSNPQGNSPVQEDNSGFTDSGTNFPEKEDVNEDYVMNDSEEYFQYRIKLKPKEEMVVGQDYLADFIDAEVNLPNGEQEAVRWYYFRVPVNGFTEKVGSVNLRNIEFIRMFMTDFERPAVCRFARLNLVRNTWRRYLPIIQEEGEYIANDLEPSSFFNLTSLSVEENGNRTPIPYTMPPEVDPEFITSGQANFNQQQNEQSAVVQVGNLQDGYARGIFKNVNVDMRQFKRLKMFVHAESLSVIDGCEQLEDGDVTAFIRIGDDFQNNYYEYELPLKVTSSENREESQSKYSGRVDPWEEYWVWAPENNMDIRLQDFIDLKVERNFDPNAPVDKPFVKFLPIVWETSEGADTIFAKIKVVGSPDMGRVKQMMLGVRNPKQNILNTNFPVEDPNYDDGFDKCAEVWFNEMRLTDFNNQAGWAALASMDIKLADLGNVTVSGNMHTPNFGNLEQAANERFRDYYYEYDASANLELGKLLPENSGIRLPVYAGVSQSVSTPEFDPYDTDVLLKQNIDSIRLFSGNDAAQAARKQRQEAVTVKSVNVTNARKERTNPERKPKVYDIENFAFTYAYTETDRRDHIIESQSDKRHKGTIAYGYNARPKYITPFAKIKSKSLYLRWLKEFNFNFIPNSVTFRNDVNRQVNAFQLRKLGNETIAPETCYDKIFRWDRTYGVTYNPARSIQVDFSAVNSSVIDEPQMGRTPLDTLWSNIRRFGRTRNYDQNTNISYNLPLDKIPLLSWTQVRTRYGSSYYWQANPIAMADTLGNLFGNTQQIQINAEFNFDKLYNSIPALKPINSNRKNRKRPQTRNKKDDGKGKDDDKDDKKKKVKRSSNDVNPVLKTLVRPLLLVRRVSVTYNEQNETIVPGFNRLPRFFGQNYDSGALPGWDIILGRQPDLKNWLEWAADDSLLVVNQYINDQVRQSTNKTLNIRANLEPFRDFKIDLTMNLTHTKNHSQFYKIDSTGVNFNHLAQVDAGSFSISYLALGTMFDKLERGDSIVFSSTFTQFEQNRQIISQRLGELYEEFTPGQVLGDYFDVLNDTLRTDFKQGYGPYSQDVLLPAFIAAYTGRDANKVNLNGLNMFPLPNWRITYNGLSKLPLFKEWFTNLTITHGYSSTMSVNNYQNNLYYDDQYYNDERLLPNDDAIVDFLVQERIRLATQGDIDTTTGNFQPYYRIPQVILNEQLSPLIGVDVTWKNGLTTRFEYRKSRTLGMSFLDYQLSEQRNEEFTIGVGYRMKGLNLGFIKFRGKPLELDNDLAFNFDMSFRDNITMNYRLDQGVIEPTSGSKTIRIAPSIDYVISQQLRISLFYERTRNIPAISTSFPITNSRGGIRLNFALGQ